MISYSQIAEDIFVFQNYINVSRADAVVIEIGAYDGSTYSNSLSLEEYSKCKCILVEPSPVNFAKIEVSRPRASKHRVAVAQSFGIAEFIGHSPVGGVADVISDDYIARWHMENNDKYKVITCPTSAIIEIENINYIDFMSIDVQGGEFNALSSMNWNVPVGVICIEFEGANPRRDAAAQGILRGMGFEFREKLHISEFWVNPDYERKNILFDSNTRMSFDSFELKHAIDWIGDLKDKFY